MADALSLLLFPIMEAMRYVIVLLHAVSGSYGVAIILLSVVVRLVTAPITKWAAGTEARERSVQLAMEPELMEIARTSKGRERFERTDALYQRHNYHPIKSVASILPLFLQLPFLLAALFLLSDFTPMAGESFLFIPDLLAQDRLISLWGGNTINLLPILITGAALLESKIKVDSTRRARLRFLIVGLVIAVLIYPAPAGVCLYWFTSTVLSLLRSALQRLGAAQSLRGVL